MCFECTAIRLLQEVAVLKNAVWGFPGGLWPRIHLAMQGILVRSLVGKDSTRRGATKLMGHNYRACASRVHALQREAPAVRGLHLTEEQPLLAATRESPRAATRTHHSQKHKELSVAFCCHTNWHKTP